MASKMIRKLIVNIILYLFIFFISMFNLSCIKNNDQILELKENFKIEVYKLWDGFVGEYVVINDSRVIFGAEGGIIIDMDIKNSEHKIIEYPDEERFSYINNMMYDSDKKQISVLLGKSSSTFGKTEKHFYFLNIVDYSWEEIIELRNKVELYYIIDSILYFVSSIYGNRYIGVFNLETRQFLEGQTMLEATESNFIYSISGENVIILIDNDQGNNIRHYSIYDFSKDKMFHFPETNTTSEVWRGLSDFVYYDEKKYFSINTIKYYKSEIVFVDLKKSTIKLIGMENNESNEVYRLKNSCKKKLSFLLNQRRLPKTTFLCFLNIEVSEHL